MIKYGNKEFKKLAEVVIYREEMDTKCKLLFDLIQKEPYSNKLIDRKIRYQALQEDINKFDNWLKSQDI